MAFEIALYIQRVSITIRSREITKADFVGRREEPNPTEKTHHPMETTWTADWSN